MMGPPLCSSWPKRSTASSKAGSAGTPASIVLGCCKTESDPCLFYKRDQDDTCTFVAVYVDDLLIIGSTDTACRNIFNDLNLEFSMKRIHHVTNYFGLQLEWHYPSQGPGSVFIHQTSYLPHVLSQSELPVHHARTPTHSSTEPTGDGQWLMMASSVKRPTKRWLVPSPTLHFAHARTYRWQAGSGYDRPWTHVHISAPTHAHVLKSNRLP